MNIAVKVKRPTTETPLHQLQYVPGTPTLPTLPPHEVLAGDSDRWLLVLVAQVINHPVEQLYREERVGRFEIVQYQKVHQPDPDILLCYDGQAKPFHQTVSLIQQLRAAGFGMRAFIREMEPLITQLTAEITKLSPRADEAIFALGWARGLQAGAIRIDPWNGVTTQVTRKHNAPGAHQPPAPNASARLIEQLESWAEQAPDYSQPLPERCRHPSIPSYRREKITDQLSEHSAVRDGLR